MQKWPKAQRCTVTLTVLLVLMGVLMCLPVSSARAAVLLDEQFNTDVITSGGWISSDASGSVDVSNGWLRIGNDGEVNDYTEKNGSFPLPLVIEWRERTFSGEGSYFSLPKLEFWWGPTQSDSKTITYVDIDNTGLGGWLFGEWTNILSLGPTNWNQWRTVKAVIRGDGGELFAKQDGDLDFTLIASATWAIPAVIQRFRISQHSDDVSDFDYIKVTTNEDLGWCDGFEGGLVNWTPYQHPSGWTATTFNPHSGQSCAAFTFPFGAGYYDASMRSNAGMFYVESGVTYRVTWWMRELSTRDTWDPAESILDIGVRTDGAWDRIAPYPLPISSEWQFVEGTVTASASGTASIDVQLHGYATSSDAVFAIDDICIAPSQPFSQQVYVDIKPGSCPNPLNTRAQGPDSQIGETGAGEIAVEKPKPDHPQPAKPVLPVAILGTENFDVSSIAVSTLRLEGVPALRWGLEDVSSPIDAGAEECECTEIGMDGLLDLTLKFDRSAVIEALGEVYDGEIIPLTISGTLLDGSPLTGTDCLVIIAGNGGSNAMVDESVSSTLANFPNPFNPTTDISFSLPKSGQVKLVVYNILGAEVATLVDEVRSAGVHRVSWNGTNSSGQQVASGIYLYRLNAGDFAATKKMLLLK